MTAKSAGSLAIWFKDTQYHLTPDDSTPTILEVTQYRRVSYLYGSKICGNDTASLVKLREERWTMY